VPSFNECVDKFIQGLRPLADGKTTVPMNEHLAEVTLDVISKVTYEIQYSVLSINCLYVVIHLILANMP